ncbi:MAG: response regulator receiver [Daejeonella sp.]|nr:response regulator receiver [Daejeonella sp.]
MLAIAVDDEPIALDIVRSHAAKVPYLTLMAEFTDAFKAIDYINKEPVDIVFLDIKMPDISGIDFVKSLNVKPLVIFTTAYSEHAVNGFDLDAVDYLLKPFSLSRFIKACNKANELFQLRNKNVQNDYIFLKTGYEQVKVHFEEILYLEAAGNYVSFVLKNKSVLSRMTFNEIETLLPLGKFIRIHRSFLVAINQINRIERHQVHIQGITIPVAETYIPKLMALANKK